MLAQLGDLGKQVEKVDPKIAEIGTLVYERAA